MLSFGYKIYTRRMKFWETAATANLKAASTPFENLASAKHGNSSTINTGNHNREKNECGKPPCEKRFE